MKPSCDDEHALQAVAVACYLRTRVDDRVRHPDFTRTHRARRLDAAEERLGRGGNDRDLAGHGRAVSRVPADHRCQNCFRPESFAITVNRTVEAKSDPRNILVICTLDGLNGLWKSVT